jgi:arylformamidase
MKIYDVSMPMRAGMPVYTNNPPFERRITQVLGKDGSPVNESQLVLGAHCGTHIDAPRHFEADGYTVDRVPLDHLIGPARLLHLPGVDKIDVKDLEILDWDGVRRVLFRTRNSDHWRRRGAFDPNFAYLTGEAARFLLSKQVKVVGIDSLGIEKYGSPDHPAHHTLLRAGVTIIEGLYLADVAPGDYVLFCGPLRIMDGEGAPARVLLTDGLP